MKNHEFTEHLRLVLKASGLPCFPGIGYSLNDGLSIMENSKGWGLYARRLDDHRFDENSVEPFLVHPIASEHQLGIIKSLFCVTDQTVHCPTHPGTS